MQKLNDLSRALTALEPNGTLIAVIEMTLSTCLVIGFVPGITTMKDEDAKGPNGEHDSLIGERSRIVNRMKAALVRLGIRGFNPKLKRASTRLDGLRTPEGEPIPPNALAELRRDMERRRLVNNQIRQI